MPSLEFNVEYSYRDDPTGGVAHSVDLEAQDMVRLLTFVDAEGENCFFREIVRSRDRLRVKLRRLRELRDPRPS